MKTFVPVSTATFIPASELFKGLDALWNQFTACALSFTFGDANRTLINPETIVSDMEVGGLHVDSDVAKEYEIFSSRMNTLMTDEGHLDPNIYIDMES
jgi:hypothetical protein